MPKVEEYKDKNQKHRIRQKADNGEISDSTQSQFEIGTETQMIDLAITSTSNTKYYPVKGSKFHK